DEYIGSLTSLLEILIKKRNDAKGMKKQHEEGSFYQSLYDKQQLAFKVLANSIYSLTGLPSSIIRDVKISAGVTSTGREQVHKLASFIKDQGYCVVYGDTNSTLLIMQQARLKEIINDYVVLFRNANSITEYTKYLYDFYNDVTKETHWVASKIAKKFNELNARDGCEIIRVVLEKCKTERFLAQHFEIYDPELVPDLLVEKYLEETDDMVCLANMNHYSNNLIRGLNIMRCEASQFQKMFECKVLYNVYDYKKIAEYMYNLGLKTTDDYVNFFMCRGQYNWMWYCADQ
ncbi:16947_t:CDS:2, partial [Dentiscutata heterogama]